LKYVSVRLKSYIAATLGLFFAGALLLSFASPVLAAVGPQEWYLDNINNPASGKNMTRTYNSVSGDLSVASGATQI
jgi:hypothetical protein